MTYDHPLFHYRSVLNNFGHAVLITNMIPFTFDETLRRPIANLDHAYLFCRQCVREWGINGDTKELVSSNVYVSSASTSLDHVTFCDTRRSENLTFTDKQLTERLRHAGERRATGRRIRAAVRKRNLRSRRKHLNRGHYARGVGIQTRLEFERVRHNKTLRSRPFWRVPIR